MDKESSLEAHWAYIQGVEWKAHFLYFGPPKHTSTFFRACSASLFFKKKKSGFVGIATEIKTIIFYFLIFEINIFINWWWCHVDCPNIYIFFILFLWGNPQPLRFGAYWVVQILQGLIVADGGLGGGVQF